MAGFSTLLPGISPGGKNEKSLLCRESYERYEK
jgi:hypothetical protein